MQIQLLNQNLNDEFGNEVYFNEAITTLTKSNK